VHCGAANCTHSVVAAADAFAAVALRSPNSGSDSTANAVVSQCSQQFDDDTAVDSDVVAVDRAAFASSSWEASPAYCASERIAAAAAAVEHNVEDQHIGDAAAGAYASRRKVARRRDRSRTKAAAAQVDCDVALEDAIVERWAAEAEEDHGSNGGEEEQLDSTDTTSVELAGGRAAVVPAEEVGVVAAAAADGDDQTLYATFREF